MRLAELGPRASYVRAIVVAALLVGALIALRLAGDAPAPRREAAVADPPALRDPVELEGSPAAVIEGRVIEYPSGRPVGGLQCGLVIPFGGLELVSAQSRSWAMSSSDGRFALSAPHSRVYVECISAATGANEENAFTPALVKVDVDRVAPVTIRVVRPREDALDAGVEFTDELDGARIQKVGRRAWSAGLLPGDRVLSVDGIPLAGLSREAMFVLAFEFPPAAAIRWTMQRGDRTLTIPVPPW